MPDEIESREPRYAARKHEAVQLRIAGLSYYQIGQRIGVSEQEAGQLVRATMHAAEVADAEKLRAMENARLDTAQARIWPKVLDGDLKAVDSFVRLSARRAAMNGLDAPRDVNLSVRIRAEMEAALAEAERTILGEVVTDDQRYA